MQEFRQKKTLFQHQIFKSGITNVMYRKVPISNTVVFEDVNSSEQVKFQ